MYVEFVEILGNIEVKNEVGGKAILFNIIDEDYTFNCIMFVNENEDPFVVLHDSDEKYESENILKIILEKYKLNELIEA